MSYGGYLNWVFCLFINVYECLKGYSILDIIFLEDIYKFNVYLGFCSKYYIIILFLW